jgi:excisionase family DNA binding protein
MNSPVSESRTGTNGTPRKPRLNSKKAAEFLAVSPDLLKRLRQEGKIQYYKIGYRTYVYEIDDLEAYLESVNHPRITGGAR